MSLMPSVASLSLWRLQVQSNTSPSDIYGGLRCAGTGFTPSTWAFLSVSSYQWSILICSSELYNLCK